MKLLLFIAVLAVVAGIFLQMRKRAAENGARPLRETNPKLTDSTRFHAVSLTTGRSACTNAREIEGKRYLAESAPRIPLTGCDVASCECRFTHHPDRRGGDDRRSPYPSPFGLETGAYQKNQRKDSDRRQNPPNSW